MGDPMLPHELVDNIGDVTPSPKKLARRLLIVDDDLAIADVIREIATSQGFAVQVVTQPRDFYAAYSEFCPDVITLDVLMPEIDGIEMLTYLGKHKCRARIILLSGAEGTLLSAAERIGLAGSLRIEGVLAKPMQIGELYKLLDELRE